MVQRPLWVSIVVVLSQVQLLCLTAAEVQLDRDFPRQVKRFLVDHCYSCHDQREARAGFRIDELDPKMASGNSAGQWLEVMNHLNLGTMPPMDQPRPDAEESFRVVKWIAGELSRAEKIAKSSGGRIPMRRLNRDEYANTVRDLLKIDEQMLASIVDDLPSDGKAEGFDRLGVALFIDQTQLERVLVAAEKISELAIVDPALPAKESYTWQPELVMERPAEEADYSLYSGVAGHLVKVGATAMRFEAKGVRWVHGIDFRDGVPAGDPWMRMAWSNPDLNRVITQNGWYRIRVRAGASRGNRQNESVRLRLDYAERTPIHETIEFQIDSPIDSPSISERLVFLRRGPDGIQRRLEPWWNPQREIISDSVAHREHVAATVGVEEEINEAIQENATPRQLEKLRRKLLINRRKASGFNGPLRQSKRNLENAPQLYIDWIEVEGPVHEEWPPASHKLLMFDGDLRRDMRYAREIIARFLPRAYRRPVTLEEVLSVMKLVETEFSRTDDFHHALRMGLQRILTSPGFLFLQEPSHVGRSAPRRLSQYEFASRLSYFLWSTMPDQQLLGLAERGKLFDPSTLRRQVSRMLADQRSREFVENFGGQWLSVREFGSVLPAVDYQDYDAELEEASKQEAYAFVEEVLRKNLPITTFLNSNFVMINERLARHYGIDGVVGEEFRRVQIRPEHHRGGVLGMAGLMTLLSDGTRTLPVRRANWIMSNLFSDPSPPPPPNAGEVQPNTEGEKLTVRQRLERHRDEATCASCHRILDPFGIALENYDAIGAWRTRQNGEDFRGRNRPKLDVSGTLPSGLAFSNLEEFKAALVAEKDRFAKAFCDRMLTYALCRPVGFADRESTSNLLEELRNDDYRIQTLVHAIVQSKAFQTK